MPSHVIDSAYFSDLYGTPEIRAVWSDHNLLQKWLDFEAALARAEAVGVDFRADADSAKAWESQIKPLAELPNTVLKLSGYLTAAHPPRLDVIQPYFEVVLEAFGANPLLYGSDYPVCITLGQSYGDTVEILRGLIAPLSPAERSAITDQTARRVYRL